MKKTNSLITKLKIGAEYLMRSINYGLASLFPVIIFSPSLLAKGFSHLSPFVKLGSVLAGYAILSMTWDELKPKVRRVQKRGVNYHITGGKFTTALALVSTLALLYSSVRYLSGTSLKDLVLFFPLSVGIPTVACLNDYLFKRGKEKMDEEFRELKKAKKSLAKESLKETSEKHNKELSISNLKSEELKGIQRESKKEENTEKKELKFKLKYV